MFDADDSRRGDLKSDKRVASSLLSIRAAPASASSRPIEPSPVDTANTSPATPVEQIPISTKEKLKPSVLTQRLRQRFWRPRAILPQDPPPAVVPDEDRAPQPVLTSRQAEKRSNAAEANYNAEIWRPLIDPGTVLVSVVRSRWAILLCTVAGVGFGVFVAVNTPKVYEAATDLLINPNDLQIVEREITQSGLSSDSILALIQNQMRIMTSGNVLRQVVDELHLEDDPEFNGKGDGGVDLNPLNRLIAVFAPADGLAKPSVRRAITIENLSRHVSVTRDSSTFVVTIRAQAQDPDKAAVIANTMSSAFLETSAKLQAETAGRATNELTGRLDELRRSLEDAERKVEAFKADNGIVDAQGRPITDDEILKLNDQLSVARGRTAELKARAATVGTLNVDAVVGGILPEQVNSNVLGQLRTQYATLRQEADRLAVRLGPRHPQRLAADVQVQSARDQIAQELRRINSSVQVELSRAQQLEQDLAGRLDTLKTRQGDLSSERVALRELERDASSKRAVYEAFLLRSRETGEQKNINTANINILSQASAPLEPSGLSRSKIAILGLLLGLAAGTGLALLRGIWDSLRGNAMLRAARHRDEPVVMRPVPVARPVATPQPEVPSSHEDTGTPLWTAPSRSDTPSFPWHVPSHEQEAMPPARQERSVPPLSSYTVDAAKRLDPAPRTATPARTGLSAVEEIRASLREFGEAVDEFRESRRRP